MSFPPSHDSATYGQLQLIHSPQFQVLHVSKTAEKNDTLTARVGRISHAMSANASQYQALSALVFQYEY